MNEILIKIPKGIQYISEWEEYTLPLGHCIVDKGVTGCGYTEYCLTNKDNIVLCSPRKLLLENKRDQHKTDLNILYLENDIENYSGVIDLKNRILTHINKCKSPLIGDSKPIKLLITYDSLHYLIRVLKESNLLDSFFFIVDEFQSIFLDSFFKASVEFDFVEVLQDCPNVLYLSATPMLKKYLKRVDEFKNLPYYELDWSETNCTELIKIKREKTKSISGSCVKIIRKFKEGDYPKKIMPDGNIYNSTEAVFYLNSVSDILRTIKKAKLKPEEVNILCANTKENRNKIKSFVYTCNYLNKGEKYVIGKIPIDGEPNKMFTFCTRSVYMGVDFYSKCASSYVFADPNLECLALDISLDLPQIMGRQRNRKNPFKSDVTVFYKTQLDKITYEDFKRTQRNKLDETNTHLNIFYEKIDIEQRESYIRKLKSDIQVSKYSRDFISISSKTGLPVHNHFIELSQERAWEVSQKDYQDSITVTKALQSEGYKIENNNSEEIKLFEEFKNNFDNSKVFSEKLKLYCEFMDNHKSNISNLVMSYVDQEFDLFYKKFGTSGCKAGKFRKSDLEIKLNSENKLLSERDMFYQKFNEGDRLTNINLKSKIQEIYDSLGIIKKAKATDINEYFKTERTKITNKETKKKEEGLRLLSRK